MLIYATVSDGHFLPALIYIKLQNLSICKIGYRCPYSIVLLVVVGLQRGVNFSLPKKVVFSFLGRG